MEEFLSIKNNFKRNTMGITLVEFFWGLSLPLVFESTFIQIFLRQMGASNFQIGLLPVLLSLGIPILALLSAYLTTHLKHKKLAVFAANTIASIPIFILGLALRYIRDDGMVLWAFFISYAVFAFSMGLLLPVWQNFLVKIFLEEDTLKALSIMHISQSITRIISGFILIRIVAVFDINQRTASILFMAAGTLMFIGSLFFLITRELPEKTDNIKSLNLKVFFNTIIIVFHNKSFIFFLFNDICFFALLSIISFYAVYATEYCNIDPAYVSGLFIVLSVLGAILFQIIFGLFNVFDYKKKFYTEKLLGFLGIMILIFTPTLEGFLLASFILGASRAIRSIAYAPVIKKLSGARDATNYFAVASIVILPFSAGLPILNGRFLDHFAYLGGDSFRIMFAFMALLVFISFLFLQKVNFDISSEVNG